MEMIVHLTNLHRFALAISLASAVGACGPDTGKAEGPNSTVFRNIEIAVDPGASLEESTESISGTGTIKFVAPLASSVDSGAHIGLTFELLDEGEGAEVSLTKFASSDLTNGVNVTWSKSATTVSAGRRSRDITSKLAGVDWSEPVSLRVEIHNNETPAHMIMWNQAISTELNETNKIYDSADTEDADLQVPGRGSGVIGGLVIKNANVTDIVILGPQEDDH